MSSDLEKKILLLNQKYSNIFMEKDKILSVPCSLPYTKPQTEKNIIEQILNTALGSAASAGIAGYLGGGLFGFFMSSFQGSNYNVHTGQADPLSMKQAWMDSKLHMKSYAKSFGSIGFLYAFFDHMIETRRARKELYNDACAGALTGFVVGFRGGLKPALLGGASFALFSYGIGLFMSRNN